MSNAQILTFDFNGLAGNEATANSNFNDANLNASTISRGAGLNPGLNGNRFNATGWAATNIANAVTGNDYMEFTITPNATYEFDVTSIDVNFQRSGTGPRGIALRSSLDGYATNIDTEKVILDNTSVQAFTFTVNQTNNATAVTYRVYGWAEAEGGTGGFEGTGNDITVNGSVNSTCTDAVDFERLVSPTTSPVTITQGDPFPVTTLATEPGVTGVPGGAPGLEAWIGYSSTNNDPSTSAGWTWILATYSGGAGNTDEHTADIGTGLAPGTYYYASRHRLNGCGFTYGGDVMSGGFWNNNSQVLIVDAAPPCSPTHTLSSFAPTEGPIGTVVTITGDDFSNTTSVDFNGTPASNITYLDSDGDGTIDTLLAEVDAGTTTGNITITEAGCPITSAGSFTVINTNGGCVTSNLSDLIITEFYDKSSGSLSYIEIYNGTGAAVNLSGYSIRRFGSPADVIAVPDNYTLYTFPVTTPTINNNQVLYVKVFSPSEPADDATPDFTFDIDCSNTNPLNPGCGGFNGSDVFHLYNGTTLIDVYENPNTGSGYTVLRDTNTSGPNATSNPGDWTYSGTESIADLGTFNYTGSTISFPSATNPANNIGSCVDTVTFTSNGTASIGGTLTYQWYYNDGVNATWSLVNGTNLPLTTVTGETTAILTLTDGLFNYDNYQFYCLVTENGSCSTRSNAAQLQIGTARWDGANWIWNNGTVLNTLPTIDDNVILNANYNTTLGNLSACNLVVNPNFNLVVENSDFVEVTNDVVVNTGGSVVIQTQGSFVQRGVGANAGTFTLLGTASSQVNKNTAPLQNWYDYTYWSSPVATADVDVALGFANPNRRFYFDATMYEDLDNDDIDDTDDDWTLATGSGTMVVGRGYAATHSNIGFTPGTSYQYNFEGALNTSDQSYTLAFNAANVDHWNLAGNPYPSAINADLLFAANADIKDAIYLWSHFKDPLAINPGNEVLNFNQNDYLLINATMEVGNGSDLNGDSVINGSDIPQRAIASGQAFFVSSTAGTAIQFNNSMRISGANANDDFYRSTSNYNTEIPNKLWINLNSDNGAYGQTGIGYVNGATDGFDDLGYDTRRNISYTNAANIYSIIPAADDIKLAIQGKSTEALSINEVIYLGFTTNISSNTIYTIKALKYQGEFLNTNAIYLKDNLLSILHDLKDSDYAFTSEAGEFNNRFEVVYNSDALSLNENEIVENEVSIIELASGDVQIKVGNNLTISQVSILDVLGRVIYNLEGNNSTEIYNLDKLSKATYIAKVKLSNGQFVVKKAIKQY
jgi:hypothetical protein